MGKVIVKKIIDSRDRDILRVLNSASSRAISGSFIARKVNLSPPAIKPRLVNLQKQGIIKSKAIGKPRIFERKFVNIIKPIKITAPSKILWGIDLKKKQKQYSKKGKKR